MQYIYIKSYLRLTNKPKKYIQSNRLKTMSSVQLQA